MLVGFSPNFFPHLFGKSPSTDADSNIFFLSCIIYVSEGKPNLVVGRGGREMEHQLPCYVRLLREREDKKVDFSALNLA